MKKILLLSILILLFTGCKVEYKLTIEDDLKVVESVNMTGTESLFDIYYKSSKLNVINMLYDDYAKNTLSENNYDSKIIEDKTPYVLATKEYDNLKSFTNNTIFYEQYFDDIEYLEKDGVITIKTKGFKPNEPDDPGRYDIKTLSIAVQSKYKILDHNASSVNKKTNTYFWEITSSTEDFEMNLKVDSKVKFNPHTDTYIGIIVSVLVIIITWVIVGYLEKHDKKKKSKNKK